MPEKDQDIRLIAIIGTALILFWSVLLIVISYLLKRKKYKYFKEKQELQAQFHQTLLQTQLEIQEQTLKNISQEIHDNIGQALSLAKLTLNTMLPVSDERLQQKILNSKDLVSKSISDLRDLSRSLDTDYVKEMGLQRAIEYEMEMMNKTETIETALIVDGTVIRLDKQKELILFRIVQETFNNIIKHAEASRLEVKVNYKPTEIELLIADNGKGVDLSPFCEQVNNTFGLGIRNMHNRAKLIGADFRMSSTLGKGTRVQIILPLETTLS